MATILAVFAHPDDETFICGGTLAKYADQGHQVVLVCATKGEMGRRMGVPPTATRESIPTLREQELKEACEALHIEDLRFLGIRDKLLEIQPFDQLTNTVLEQIIDSKPDVVITFHEVLGGHPDHCTIGLATTTAVNMYQKNAPDSNMRLFYVCWSNVAENPQEYGFLPEQIVKVDVSQHNTAKLKAFRAHRTQTELDEWLWRSDEISVKQFSGVEHFIQVNGPFKGKTKTLV